MRILKWAIVVLILCFALSTASVRADESRDDRYPGVSVGSGGGSFGLVGRARAHLGQTAAQVGVRRTLWCAAFVNSLLGGGTGSNFAGSFSTYGSPAPEGCVGCLAVSRRKGGGHVGIVSGWNGRNPILISGNCSRKVCEGEYPRSRIYALRWPS